MSESTDYVVGVDGCPGGWVAVELRGSGWSSMVFRLFTELLAAHTGAAYTGVDIPIGLTGGDVRACDTALRRMIRPRGSCVFNPPDPRILTCQTQPEAMAILRELGLPGVSKQTIDIMSKIAEVNELMTAKLQSRIMEVHPEVSFCALNCYTPIMTKKSRSAGINERSELLRPVWASLSEGDENCDRALRSQDRTMCLMQ